MEKEPLTSKTEANYKVSSDGESPCSSCANFIIPDSCSLVSGTISENGTCDFFSPLEKQDVSSMLFGGSNG